MYVDSNRQEIIDLGAITHLQILSQIDNERISLQVCTYMYIIIYIIEQLYSFSMYIGKESIKEFRSGCR
jgi:hypothetical protein